MHGIFGTLQDLHAAPKSKMTVNGEGYKSDNEEFVP